MYPGGVTVWKPRMSEEAFRALLEATSRHFAALTILDASPEVVEGGEPEGRPGRPLRSSQGTFRSLAPNSASSPILFNRFSCDEIFNPDTRCIEVVALVRASRNREYLAWANQASLYGYLDRPFQVVPLSFVESKLRIGCPNCIIKPLSYMESTKAATTDEKSNDEKMSPAVQRTTASSKPWQILFFVLLSIATSLIYNLYLDLYKKPARLAQFDFFDTANELRERVYGQRVAIEELIDYFTADTEEFKVAVLVGGTGVGKSLASEIIMKNFPNGRYVFVYFPPLPSNESSLCDRLSSTRCNLIVLENLREVDITSAAKMTDLVEQCTDRHRVAVVALINMEETREDLTRHLDLAAATSKVRNAFQGKNLNAKVIGFTTLDDEALDTCIEHAAAEKNTLLSRKHVVEIRNILRTTGSGCKGAYAKVDLFRKDLEPPHDRTSSK